VGIVIRAGLASAALALIAATPVPVAPPMPAVVSMATIKTGVEKWRAGAYAEAVTIWKPFAAAGDPDALFNLGQAYKLGRGVTADPAAARDYYRKAAAKGHLPAQANLGISLFQTGEKPEAVRWLRMAADRGEARAQYVLGIAAFNGDGLVRAQGLGYGYLLRSAASGLPQATTALGSVEPALSPSDRTIGETVAASLAAGKGVPAGLALATAPRLITSPPSPSATPLRTTATLPPPPLIKAPPPPAVPLSVTTETGALKPDIATPEAPGWRVQLGAFAQRRQADEAWASLHGEALGAGVKPIFATDGSVTRLQIGPYPTRDAARAACTKLSENGRACFVTSG